jgi:hypothetical protein
MAVFRRLVWVGPSESRSTAPPIPATAPLSEYCQSVRLLQAEGIDGTYAPYEAIHSGSPLNAVLSAVQESHQPVVV